MHYVPPHQLDISISENLTKLLRLYLLPRQRTWRQNIDDLRVFILLRLHLFFKSISFLEIRFDFGPWRPTLEAGSFFFKTQITVKPY